MKNRTLLLVLLAIGFVGATSCGNDNSQNSQLAAENAALRAALAQRAAQGNTVNVTMTQVATAVANVTLTNVSSTTATSGGGTTVVYTITSNNTGTAVRQ